MLKALVFQLLESTSLSSRRFHLSTLRHYNEEAKVANAADVVEAAAVRITSVGGGASLTLA